LEEEMKTESAASLKKNNHVSNECSDLQHGSGSKKDNPSLNNQVIAKPKVVKKIENTLKNFELNSGGNRQEFFKNVTGVIHPSNPMAAVTGSSLGSDERLK
jgi:hypothetical protein